MLIYVKYYRRTEGEKAYLVLITRYHKPCGNFAIASWQLLAIGERRTALSLQISERKGKSMKKLLFIILISFVSDSAHATDVGVSISLGQPGFYGRIDIGNAPQPELIYPRPVVIRPAPAHVVQEPLYLRVPPGHAKNWKKHCAEYNACGRPVFFVRDTWYNNIYVPHYRKQKEEYERRGHGYKDDRNHGDRYGNRGQNREYSDKKEHDKGRRGKWIGISDQFVVPVSKEMINQWGHVNRAGLTPFSSVSSSAA